MKDVILLPTYNERDNVAVIIPEIFRIRPDVYIVVIDDNSPDGTGEVVQELTINYPHLSLLSRPAKNGLGEAYKDALSRLKGDADIRAIVMMDADGSHAPEYLPELLRAVGEYDMVIGSRYAEGGGIERWEFWRKYLSAGGNFYARFITGVPIHDMTAGFIAFRRELLNLIDLDRVSAAGYAFLMEFKFYAHRAGATVAEIPIVFHERRGGESKISHQIIREGLKTPWRLLAKRLWQR